MRPEQKTFLTTALEALGPARVTRGLEATGHSWNDCFLAIATYGEPGAFVHELKNRRRTDANAFASNLIDVPLGVVYEVAGLWDHDEPWFRLLAAEWLELNRAPVPTQPLVGA